MVVLDDEDDNFFFKIFLNVCHVHYLRLQTWHFNETDYGKQPVSYYTLNSLFTLQGYHQENTFLVTQWPKRKTVNDLWRLLFDFKITSLVVLNEVKFSRVCYAYLCFYSIFTSVVKNYKGEYN